MRTKTTLSTLLCILLSMFFLSCTETTNETVELTDAEVSLATLEENVTIYPSSLKDEKYTFNLNVDEDLYRVKVTDPTKTCVRITDKDGTVCYRGFLSKDEYNNCLTGDALVSLSKGKYELFFTDEVAPEETEIEEDEPATRIDAVAHAKTHYNIDLHRVSKNVGLGIQLTDKSPAEYGAWGAEWPHAYAWKWSNVEAKQYKKKNRSKVILWKGNYRKSTYGWGAGAEIGYYYNERVWNGWDTSVFPWKNKYRDKWVPRDHHRTKMEFVLVNKKNKRVVASNNRNRANIRGDKKHWWIQRFSGQTLETWDLVMYYRVDKFWGSTWRIWEGTVKDKGPNAKYPWGIFIKS